MSERLGGVTPWVGGEVGGTSVGSVSNTPSCVFSILIKACLAAGGLSISLVNIVRAVGSPLLRGGWFDGGITSSLSSSFLGVSRARLPLDELKDTTVPVFEVGVVGVSSTLFVSGSVSCLVTSRMANQLLAARSGV